MRRSVVLTALLLAGCDFGGESYKPPELVPSDIGQRALDEFDADGDSQLNKSELKACPALLESMEQYDVDGSNTISKEEIAERVQKLLDSRVAYMDCTCEVHFRGKPLADAVVELIPESFLGDEIDPARGVAEGHAAVANLSHEVGPGGVRFGLYKVRITHPTKRIPKKYNDETELGWEVTPLNRGGDAKIFDLN